MKKSQKPLKILLVFVLLITTFVYAMFQGGFVSWFLFYSFLPFGLYSVLIMIYPIHHFHVTRQINQDEFAVGQKFIAHVRLERKFPFPLFFLILEDVLPESLMKKQKIHTSKIVFPWFKRVISYQYELDSMPRGDHHLSVIRVKTGDFLGLIEKEKTYQVDDRFLVYPQFVSLAYKQQDRALEKGDTAAKGQFIKDTTIAIGVREYQPGDRVAWIDWKSSARKDSLMTKEFEQLHSHDVVVMMDRSTTPAFEPLVTFTASLTRSIIKSGTKMAFLSKGKTDFRLPLKSSNEQLHKVFYHLAKVNCDAQYPFAQIIQSEIGKWNKHYLIMIITSQLTDEVVHVLSKNTKSQPIIWLVKDAPLSKEDTLRIEQLKRRSIIVRVVYEGRYEEAFSEVNAI
ncbi:DUF58 domain-containing protein [Bacillus carboniphilus]|uniref:DUF58 domain-containing protein n=1 Tax=Bacillus carboniphilus TaxID=86663 RepID=A0ABY9JU11_9BACI|nr:DUF58 domain-containing protein [Bacillus carboniphilus]WLR42233.1 DUF58 domain-containing protein [Bacillus carboniphilus]